MHSVGVYVLLQLLLPSLALAACVTETLNLTWAEGAPNGQSRDMIFTNGQFPGPNLIFDEDDEVEITVYNELPINITVHWHGLAQTGTPWSDGVPGLTQEPIQPGKSFIYRFTASPSGTFWYHAHDRMALVDGLYGALFIRQREDRRNEGPWSQISQDPDDIKALAQAAANPKLIVLSDWSRFTSEEYWKANVDSKLLVFCVDSILANGQGAVYCPPMDFLIDQTQPGISASAFPPGVHVTDKGCFPFTEAVEGIWVNQSHPEKVPPHMQSGCIPSTGSNATIEVDPADGWVSMNFVGAQSTKQIYFSIDEHPMWIYEIDGNLVNPIRYVAAAISEGERFSAMVKLDKPLGTYTIRLPESGSTQVISGFANMVYKGSNSTRQSEPYVTYGGLNASEITSIDSFTPWALETDRMGPFPTAPPPYGVADEEYLLVMGRDNATNMYTMNTKYMYPIDYRSNNPFLYNPNTTLGTDEGLVIRTKNGSWVDLVVQVSDLPGDSAAFTHVLHKHGSKTWRIGHGQGDWKYSSVSEAVSQNPNNFNFENPGYRDTWLTDFSPVALGGWWSVLRYQVTNPGPWLFHCHIELHQMGGMAIAILDGVDAWPEIPEEYQKGRSGY